MNESAVELILCSFWFIQHLAETSASDHLSAAKIFPVRGSWALANCQILLHLAERIQEPLTLHKKSCEH